jgi:hypothetical protein
MPRPHAIRRTALGGMAAALIGCGVLVGLGTAAAPADTPDLAPLLPAGLSNVNDRWVDTQQLPGRTLYRFDTVILNVGGGAFEVYRDAAGTTYQRIWNGGDPGGIGSPKSFPGGAPGFEDRPLGSGGAGQPNALRYSSAYGHDHFHSQRIASYTLLTPAGAPVVEAAKNYAGFCLYDSWGPPSSGAPARYPAGTGTNGACASGQPGYSGLLRMGIQADWGDFYGSQLYDQWVDVTGVTPGTYRLRATVDPDGLYQESDEANNTAEAASVVIPGVVASPASVATPVGSAVAVPLSASVVGASVKSRQASCTDAQTTLASCMTTANPTAVALAVAQPPAGRGAVTLRGATATYTPPVGFSGTTTFTYTGTDSRGLVSAPATVTVRVGAAAAGGSGAGAAGGPGGAAGAKKKSRITLSARQLLISQRIAQAALRRLRAVEAKLDGRPAPAAAARRRGDTVTLTARQLLINQRIGQAGVRLADALEARVAGRAVPAVSGRRKGGTVRLTVGQLVINQKIAQAAVRRANALQERVG